MNLTSLLWMVLSQNCIPICITLLLVICIPHKFCTQYAHSMSTLGKSRDIHTGCILIFLETAQSRARAAYSCIYVFYILIFYDQHLFFRPNSTEERNLWHLLACANVFFFFFFFVFAHMIINRGHNHVLHILSTFDKFGELKFY